MSDTNTSTTAVAIDPALKELVEDNDTGEISKKRMLSEAADLKQYEAKDFDTDHVVTAKVEHAEALAATGGLNDVPTEIVEQLRAKVATIPKESFNIEPALKFGFTYDELLCNFLRWSQKDEDMTAHRYNIDKAFRRLEEFGKFFTKYAAFYNEPLVPEVCVQSLNMLGFVDDVGGFGHDGFGRTVVNFSVVDLPLTRPDVKAEIKKKKEDGTMHIEFVRAYTYLCFVIMRDPASARQGSVFLCDYGFMGMTVASSLQSVMGGKLKKVMGKLFHGTCPIKVKSIIMLNSPWWMRMMIAVARVFVSSKIMGRMHVLTDDHTKLVKYFGGIEHVPVTYREGLKSLKPTGGATKKK